MGGVEREKIESITIATLFLMEEAGVQRQKSTQMPHLSALDTRVKEREMTDIGPASHWGLLEVTLDEDLAK